MSGASIGVNFDLNNVASIWIRRRRCVNDEIDVYLDRVLTATSLEEMELEN